LNAAITQAELAKARVLVVGDAMLDRYWHGQVERISPEAPVPIVLVKREEERVGAAANVAHNVASLGAGASFLGPVGTDSAGDKLVELLAKTNIQNHAVRDATLATTIKLRVIGRQQQLLRLDFEGSPSAAALTEQAKLFEQLLPSHQAVLLTDYGKGALAQVQGLIAAATARQVPAFVDPKGTDFSRYTGATALTPNKGELQAVVGHWANEAELTHRAQNLREHLRLQTLVLTRSEEGMSLYDSQGELHVRAQAQEVFDVTGAGDTVIAVLAALHAAGLSLRQALPLANKAGGLVVGRFGTAAVSLEELFSAG
jgi:rfaE bifunctional protein kinase chain/domain